MTDSASSPEQAPAPADLPEPAPTGRLYVCATPIGNLGDITERVVQALQSVDAVLAEDTRVTRRLLSHLNIHLPIERCDENLLRPRLAELLKRLAAGERLALVSDAGTPGISDPGMELIAACRAAGIDVEVLPGASAVLTALVGSGFTFSAFYFGGFLPRKNNERLRLLASLAELPAALVFYESPHRTAASLQAISATMPARPVSVARELTKLYEEYRVGTAAELLEALAGPATPHSLKGEVTIVIAPPAPAKTPRQHRDKYAPA